VSCNIVGGAHSGNKINPMDVARNMRVCVDEDGNIDVPIT
jgi:hypothetical protein